MIINFTLDKISISKEKEVQGNIEAKNSIKFTDVSESPIPKGIKDQSLLKFKFEYRVDYTPKIAATEIVGHIHYLVPKKESKKIMKEWDKNSKIDPEISTRFINTILTKCGVRALVLCQEVGLPPHIPLPKIIVKKKESTKKETKPKAS
tara:strand:+ start:493 stop:939 length:447 start_codon:yes stop_codon:yes gene_type:complete